jgi:signal transduction histidine kinase
MIILMRMVVTRVLEAVFTVAGTADPEARRRASLLLTMAASLMTVLLAAGLTMELAPDNVHTWAVGLGAGVPATLAAFLLARRARSSASALLLVGFSFVFLAVVAWTEGPSSFRMSITILGVVVAGAVISTRLTALFGAGLIAIIVGLAIAESRGLYHAIGVASLESAHAPFIRQSLALGVMVVLLRNSYDSVQRQIRVRERARVDAVEEVRTINDSLEALVAERTATLAATRDRLHDLAERLAADLGASLGSMRQRLDAFAIRETDLESAVRRHVSKASAAVERLSVMTERLHEHSKVGRAAFRPERIDMTALVRDVIDEHDRTASGSTTPVEWQVDELPAAWADPALIRTVVENLIGNALKFSRHQRPSRVTIGYDPVRGYLVRDNGVGFDPRHADRLFSAFQRLHREDEFEGTGLGLANVQRILQRSGGGITATSELGHGAEFAFQLPSGLEDHAC